MTERENAPGAGVNGSEEVRQGHVALAGEEGGDVWKVAGLIGSDLAVATVETLCAVAVSEGMTSMFADGLRQATGGQTAVEEIERVLAKR